jgi:hypothetical protein
MPAIGFTGSRQRGTGSPNQVKAIEVKESGEDDEFVQV